MRQILRRYITRNPAGGTLHQRTERLTDDGNGHLEQRHIDTAIECGSCHRPITVVSELRGLCDYCHQRTCCVQCIRVCQVCSRQLCGNCRRGFVGPPLLTVCIICQQMLCVRQRVMDQQMQEQSAFDRQMQNQRLLHQAQSMYLTAQRMQQANQIQLLRMQNILPPNDPPPIWKQLGGVVIRGTSKLCMKVIDHVRRYFS